MRCYVWEVLAANGAWARGSRGRRSIVILSDRMTNTLLLECGSGDGVAVLEDGPYDSHS